MTILVKEDGDETPDPPVVAELKKLDDKYLEIHRELEKELAKLEQKRNEKQKPFLDQRAELLRKGDEKTGTPALKGFWLEALSNHSDLEEMIYEWDRPVLEYLRDVIVKPLNPDNLFGGFRYTFHFAENPYFENAVLSVEHHCEERSPYRGDDEKGVVVEARGCNIKWKRGKDVTVELVVPKTKGKKTKGRAGTEESRESFFRDFFRTIKASDQLPEDIDAHQLAMELGADDELEESDLVGVYLESQGERGDAMRQVVAHAVRWYTGEACPDDDDEDDDEDDEEEDNDDEDDDDDEEDEDEEDNKKKTAAKKEAKTDESKDAQKTEECKQQ